MQYLFYILLIPFLYFNYKIIVSDLKFKKIPNKYLGYLLFLLPFWWMFLYTSPLTPLLSGEGNINIILFLGQIFLTFLVSFILYYFGIWAAGDAKYLLVLSLFIPYIGIVPFVGNIALITLSYLFLYFVWFYFGKCIFVKGYAKSLSLQIKTDLREKWNVYKGNKTSPQPSPLKGEGVATFFIALKWLVVFLIIFVSIRLIRIYLFNEFHTSPLAPLLLEEGNIFEKYHFYLIFVLIGIFIGGLYLIKFLVAKLKGFISNKLNLNLNLIGNIFISFLFIILSSFIVYEYLKNPSEISKLLFLIFTLYIGIYIIFKVLIYSYKITFGIAEMDYIHIKDLKEGDVVDKEYLIKIFGEQSSIGFAKTKEKKEERKNYLLSPEPKDYFLSMDRTISKENLEIIKKCYRTVNKYHEKQKTKGYSKISTIKILNTFSFAPYILGGFIVTFIFENKIFSYIIDIISIIKSYY